MSAQILMDLSFTSGSRPGAQMRRYHDQTVRLSSMEEVETKLEEVCGQFPPRRPRGIFIDGPKGTALQTGFMVAGWSSFSRGSFWREIWVTFEQVGRPVELPKRFRAKS